MINAIQIQWRNRAMKKIPKIFKGTEAGPWQNYKLMGPTEAKAFFGRGQWVERGEDWI